MAEFIQTLASVQTFLLALFVFGFAPGFFLRVLVTIYPRDDPRRTELLAELYAIKRLERPFFVMEQLETVLFEGLPLRVRSLRKKRARRPVHHGRTLVVIKPTLEPRTRALHALAGASWAKWGDYIAEVAPLCVMGTVAAIIAAIAMDGDPLIAAVTIVIVAGLLLLPPALGFLLSLIVSLVRGVPRKVGRSRGRL